MDPANGFLTISTICHVLKRARNGEPIKTGTDGNWNFDQSKMLFLVMCHLLYTETTIFTKISDYATAVFSVHSMMRPLKCTWTFQYGGDCIRFNKLLIILYIEVLVLIFLFYYCFYCILLQCSILQLFMIFFTLFYNLYSSSFLQKPMWSR